MTKLLAFIEEQRKLEQAATKGPWDIHSKSRGIMGYLRDSKVGTWVTRDKFNNKHDEIFIAESRNNYARLLDAVEMLSEALTQASADLYYIGRGGEKQCEETLKAVERLLTGKRSEPTGEKT